MASKVKIELFNNKVKKFVVGLGGTITTDNDYVTIISINTKAGNLDVQLHKPDSADYFFGIFSYFDEPKKAAELIPLDILLNTWSGKYNIRYTHSNISMQQFKIFLKSVL